jgi:hypothetical protein
MRVFVFLGSLLVISKTRRQVYTTYTIDTTLQCGSLSCVSSTISGTIGSDRLKDPVGRG